MLDIVESGNEREYELSISAPIRRRFGKASECRRREGPRPGGVHPLQKIERTPLRLFARNLFLGAAAMTLVVGLVLSASGTTIERTGARRAAEDLVLPFEVTAGRGLTEIEIWADVNNSWAWFEAELTDDEDEPVAEFERGLEYYKGSDWSEGSRTRADAPASRSRALYADPCDDRGRGGLARRSAGRCDVGHDT